MNAVAESLDEEVAFVGLRAPRSDGRGEPTCPLCGEPKLLGASRCDACRGVHYVHGATVHSTLPFASDKAARAFVEQRGGDGATLDEIGRALGITRQGVEQIEARALRKLKAAAQLAGIRREDIVEILCQRVTRGDDVPSGHPITKHERALRVSAAERDEREAALAEPSEWLADLYALLDEAQAVADAVIRASEAP